MGGYFVEVEIRNKVLILTFFPLLNQYNLAFLELKGYLQELY